jgi:hypothetical protein
MVFSWFDTSEVDAFATSLVNEFMQRLPRESLGPSVRGAQSRLREATEGLLKRVERFASGRRLNLFKRARLANTLKWQLHEAGYDKAMVDELTLDVAKRVSLAKRAAKQNTVGNKTN